ncbi:hypothetical protein ACSSWA_01310 [Melioribacter sp. Ez-97]|uniref:hypothetical protein n=1 Tax=Melioribacter sp. Ez-97 TaxID=3423434 RepID=UPI003EDA1DD9
MATADTLELRLTIDGREAIAVLDLTKGEFVEMNDEAQKASGALQTALKKVADVASGANKQLQNTNTQVKGLNAAAGSTVPGVNNMTMAVSQFGWILGDANMFLVNARMGMMSIANNIPMVVQAFTQARQAAQGQATVMQQLTAAITGGGGLLLGINALMFVMQLLPSIFEDSTEEVKKQKEEIDKLRDSYQKLSIQQIDNEIQKIKIKLSNEPFIITAGIPQLGIEPEQIFTSEEGKQLKAQLDLLYEIKNNMGDLTALENRRLELNEKIKNLQHVTEGPISPHNLELLDQYKAELESINERIDYIRNNADRTNKDVFKKAEEELVLAQEHAIKMAQIEGNNDAIILEMKKQHLVERINLYEKYGKDFTALMYELYETEAELQKALKAPDIKTDVGEPEDILLQDYKNKEDYEKEFLQSQLDSWYAAEDEKIKAYENYNELKIALDEEYARRKRALDQQAVMNTLQITSQILGQLAGLFSKHTAAYKLLAVAQVWIETYKAVAALYAPPPTGVGPAIAPFMTAAVIGMGALQAANIMKQDTTMKGYARGGAIVGENGVEIIAPAEDYATGMAELVDRTVREVRNYMYITNGGADNAGMLMKIDTLTRRIEELASRPAIAYFDNEEALKVGRYYDYEQRTSR